MDEYVQVALPKLVVFDLDLCCWSPEVCQADVGSPFQYNRANNECVPADGRGPTVRLLGDTREIWSALHSSPLFADTRIAIASSASRPHVAQELLTLFEIDSNGTKMSTCVQCVQTLSGSKQNHFQTISSLLGVSFGDMIFFDHLLENINDVSCLGVTAVHTPHGVTGDCFRAALSLFAQLRAPERLPEIAFAGVPPPSALEGFDLEQDGHDSEIEEELTDTRRDLRLERLTGAAPPTSCDYFRLGDPCVVSNVTKCANITEKKPSAPSPGTFKFRQRADLAQTEKSHMLIASMKASSVRRQVACFDDGQEQDSMSEDDENMWVSGQGQRRVAANSDDDMAL